MRQVWLTPEQEGKKFVRGSVIVTINRVVIKAIQFGRMVVIARLIFPHDFGLFALAATVVGAVDALINPGLNAALVQSRGDVKQSLNSVWTITVVRGVALTALLWVVGAPLAGQLLNNEAVVPLVRLMACTLLVNSFENVGVSLLQREMRFNRQFVYLVSGVIGEAAVTVAAALILQNAWALAIGALAGRFVHLVVSYLVHPYRPRLDFHFGASRQLIRFGWLVGLSGIIAFVVGQGDRLIVGGLLNTSALGFYQLAFALGTLPAVEIGRSLNGVFFPMYARMQTDVERLRSAFIRVTRIIFVAVLPAVAGLAILAPEVVTVVYGPRWLPMVPLLYVALAFGVLKAFDFMANPVLLGYGQARAQVVTLVVQAVAFFALVVPATQRWGVVGTAGTVTVALALGQLVNVYMLRQKVGVRLRSLAGAVGLAALASVCMAAVVLTLRAALPDAATVPSLVALVLCGAVTYGGCLYLFDGIFKHALQTSWVWLKQNR